MSRKIFYISDTHFGHESIIKMDGRPFNSLEEMDLELVRRWNNKVENGDMVYILGDFSWKMSDEYIALLKTLKGQKILILGNHDFKHASTKYKSIFQTMKDYEEINDNGRKVILSHYPIMLFDGHYRENGYHLYGHVHTTHEYEITKDFIKHLTNSLIPCKMYNVGAMLHNYEPVTLDEIIERGIV